MMTTKKGKKIAEMWLKMATKVADGELNVTNLSKYGCKVVDAVSDSPDVPEFVKMSLVQIKPCPGGVCIPVLVDSNGNLSEPSDKTGWKVSSNHSSSTESADSNSFVEAARSKQKDTISTPKGTTEKIDRRRRADPERISHKGDLYINTDVYIPRDDEDDLTYLHKILGLEGKKKEEKSDEKQSSNRFNDCQFSFCECTSNTCEKMYCARSSRHGRYDYNKSWQRFVETVNPIDGQRASRKNGSLFLCACHFPNGLLSRMPILTDTDIKKLCLRQRNDLAQLRSKLDMIMTGLRKTFDEGQILIMLGIDQHGNKVDRLGNLLDQDPGSKDVTKDSLENETKQAQEAATKDSSEEDSDTDDGDEEEKGKKENKRKRRSVVEYSNVSILKGLKLCTMMSSHKYVETKKILGFPMPVFAVLRRFAKRVDSGSYVFEPVNTLPSTTAIEALWRVKSNGNTRSIKKPRGKEREKPPKGMTMCPITGKVVVTPQVDPEEAKRVAKEFIKAVNERRCRPGGTTATSTESSKSVPKRRRSSKKKMSESPNSSKKRKPNEDGSPSKINTSHNRFYDNQPPMIDFQFLVNSINDTHHHHHPM